MKINKSRHRSSRNTSRRKYKNINKSRKRIKKTHKKYLVRLKKYNKNIRHRKYYTRKVNRYKRGGAELQPITAEFNFSFPLRNDPFGKLMVNDNGIPKFTDGYGINDDNIFIRAGGWGYVTKKGLYSQNRREEQLIVYQIEGNDGYYCIARCTFSDCTIVPKGYQNIRANATDTNMEKPIIVEKKNVKVKRINNKLKIEFKTFYNKYYTIEVVPRTVNENVTISINGVDNVLTLYTFFNNILETPSTPPTPTTR
jgi:hypothetical protein